MHFHVWRHLVEILLEKRTSGPFVVLQKCQAKALQFNLVGSQDLSAREEPLAAAARAGWAPLALRKGLSLVQPQLLCPAWDGSVPRHCLGLFPGQGDGWMSSEDDANAVPQPFQCPGSALRLLPGSMGTAGRGAGRALPNTVPGTGMSLRVALLGVAWGAGHMLQVRGTTEWVTPPMPNQGAMQGSSLMPLMFN